jgi:hypothetical protein
MQSAAGLRVGHGRTDRLRRFRITGVEKGLNLGRVPMHDNSLNHAMPVSRSVVVVYRSKYDFGT